MSGTAAIPVFMYHHVSLAPGLVTLSPETFRLQMAALAENGWKTASLDELAAFLAGATLPKRTCILTFDDGYLDNFVHAHPILAEFGLHAVLFVVTDWLCDGPVRQGVSGNVSHNACKEAIAAGRADDVVLRWSEMEAMQAAGTFEFHSHTHTHQRWDRLIADPVARREALAGDLAQSQAVLTQRLGSKTEHLCWPQGYHDALYRDCAQQLGFKYLYTTEKKVVSRKVDISQIGRIVTKEKPGKWLLNRASWFSRPWLGSAYAYLQGH